MMTPAMPPAASQMEHRHSHASVWFLGILTMVLIVFIVGAGIFLYQRKGELDARNTLAENRVTQLEGQLLDANAEIMALETAATAVEDEPDFAEILVFPTDTNFGYRGVAEIRGYYTTVQVPTTLAPEPTTTCAAFMPTDGPADAWDDGAIILGEIDVMLESPWWNSPELRSSSVDNTVTALFRIGTKFEGEATGCFNPFAEFIGTTPNS